MRANGLLALYFKKHMKLESMAKELVWVNKEALKKAQLESETPAQTKARKQKEMLVNAAAIVGFLVVVGGVVWYVMQPTKEAAPPAPAAAGAAPDAAVPGAAAPGAAAPGAAAPMMAPPAGAPGGAPGQ